MKLDRRDLALLVALTLMWGVNWPMMKFSLRELSPLWFRAITMTGGALCLYAFFTWRGVAMHPNRRELAQVAWLALPNILGWHLFSILGLSELASGRAAILGFTMPVWTVLLGVLLFGERMRRRVWLSVVMAVAAVGLLSAGELSALAGRPVGVLWMQVAALSWALGTLLMRRSRLALPTEAVTVWMMLLASVAFWALAIGLEAPPQPASWTAGLWGSLAYGVLLNYGYAQVIWFGMARRLPPMASAFSIMAVPVVGTLSAMAIVGERPSVADIVAAGCIMIAIASALLPERRRAVDGSPPGGAAA